MVRPQSTKELSKRIDPQYYRRPSGGRRFRFFLSVILVAGAAGWWFWAGPGGRHRAVNPGHVSSAHAMWENDCAKCHDNDGKGGFRAAVSDSACRQCHAAPAHHSSQLLRAGANAQSDLAMAVSDGKGAFHSTNCTACHVEHRGKKLTAVDDSACTKCHENINAATTPGAAHTVAVNVTAFNNTGGHPYFGVEWTKSGTLPQPPATLDPALLVDPTHLQFHHDRHMKEDADISHGAAENCTVCHVPEGKSMRPISFARDCQSCHELNLPNGAALPHVRMELLASTVAHVDEFYRGWLTRLPAAKRTEVLNGKEPEQWIKDSATQFRTSAGEWVGRLEKGKRTMPGAAALEDALAAELSETGQVEPEKAGADPRVAPAFVAYGMTSRCSKCHDVKDLTAVAAQSKPASEPVAAAADAPATLAATAPRIPLLNTVPTGIPDRPRRWFVKSSFDHRAHQNLSCVSCHSRAKTSTLTSDVLSPNLIWTETSGTVVSCAACHHPPTPDNRGAGSNCVTCHSFHDGSIPTTPVKRFDVSHVLQAAK